MFTPIFSNDMDSLAYTLSRIEEYCASIRRYAAEGCYLMDEHIDKLISEAEELKYFKRECK